MTQVGVRFDDLVKAVAAGEAKTPRGELERAVEVAADVARIADDVVDHFVERARTAGCSWAEIGAVLGVSRQGAQQRFGGFANSDRHCKHLEAPLTPRARRALRQANREARRAGASDIDAAHLLLALLRDPRGVATKTLLWMGVAPGDVEAALDLQPSGSTASRANTGASSVLRRALEEAQSLGHDYIGTEHLLLGLLAEPGRCSDVAASLGGDYDGARRHVLELLDAASADVRRGRLKVRARSAP